MKRTIILILMVILFSGCVLVSETPPTPTPMYATQMTSTLPPTATVKITATQQDTQSPTSEPTLENTSVPTLTNTPQNTATPFPIILQTGAPVYIKNYAHTTEGCNWLGAAGQIFDAEGKPLLNKVVLIKGKIDGQPFEKVGVTGTPEADIYGPGGYEIVLSNSPFNSAEVFSIQIFDLNGIPISDMIFFDTYTDCGKNLIIINFQFG